MDGWIGWLDKIDIDRYRPTLTLTCSTSSARWLRSSHSPRKLRSRVRGRVRGRVRSRVRGRVAVLAQSSEAA